MLKPRFVQVEVDAVDSAELTGVLSLLAAALLAHFRCKAR